MWATERGEESELILKLVIQVLKATPCNHAAHAMPNKVYYHFLIAQISLNVSSYFLCKALTHFQDFAVSGCLIRLGEEEVS